MCWAAAILLAEAKQVPLYHICDCRWKEGQDVKSKLFHRILEDFCESGPPPKNAETLSLEPYNAIHEKCLALLEIPPTILHHRCYNNRALMYSVFNSPQALSDLK